MRRHYRVPARSWCETFRWRAIRFITRAIVAVVMFNVTSRLEGTASGRHAVYRVFRVRRFLKAVNNMAAKKSWGQRRLAHGASRCNRCQTDRKLPGGSKRHSPRAIIETSPALSCPISIAILQSGIILDPAHNQPHQPNPWASQSHPTRKRLAAVHIACFCHPQIRTPRGSTMHLHN